MAFIPTRIGATGGFKMVTLLCSSVSKRSLAVGLTPSRRNATIELLFTPPHPCGEQVHKTPSLYDRVEKTVRGWLGASRPDILVGNSHSQAGRKCNLCRFSREQFIGCGELVHRVVHGSGGAA